jgi:hypothetical protein
LKYYVYCNITYLANQLLQYRHGTPPVPAARRINILPQEYILGKVWLTLYR